MKKKNNIPEKDANLRIPPIPLPESGKQADSLVPEMLQPPFPDDEITQDELLAYRDNQSVEEYLADSLPVELDLYAHANRYDNTGSSNDPSEDEYLDSGSYSSAKVKKSRSSTVYEPRQRKKHWLKPVYVLISLAILAAVVLAGSLYYGVNMKEQFASPMTLKDEPISNADFSFMYHYVLIENKINIFDSNTAAVLSSPGEDNFATYREYFIDMAARELQVTQLLYDDAISKGYEINEPQKLRAQAYVDWLSGKAQTIGVDLDTYIKGYFGAYVTKDQILKILAKKYFTEDYANGAKLEELKATSGQAEEAYAASPNQYDLVSYRVLRIVFEQTDDTFKATAHLHAQEIIDGIGHDETKFESVAANFFTGEAKNKILVPNSTLISNVRYTNVDNADWRAWLFDKARLPGDCTIFDDTNGFPILICFSARTRQLEPLRDIRFLYINREDTVTGQVGIPDTEILPVAQTILDSITDESSMQSLETTYADEIAADKFKAAHNSNTYKGVLANNLDNWIFDPTRAAGDKTMIETDTQIIIAYYVGASPNPEWFDRVNSYIRMNNYQAFLLERQTEYPYSFNDDGLQYIKDVP